MKKRNILFVVLALTALGLTFAWLLARETDERVLAAAPGPVQDPAPQTVAAMTPPAVKPPPLYEVTLSPADAEFIAALRERFKAAIHGKHTQIKAIEQLIAYLMAQYPEDWSLRIYAFLQQLFPQLADQLYAQFQQLTQYNNWLRDNREALLRMSPAERRAALLAARQAAFGADAAEIWLAEERNVRIQDSLTALNTTQGVPLEQKLTTYLGVINDAYGEQAPAFVEMRQTELMNGFLAVESVQSDLHALPPAQRSAALLDIRRGMGMDAAALQRWDELDRNRDQAWDSGQRYMAERERIQKEYDGADADRELQRLQEESFGAEAETIRNEEQSGFYRYSHRRRVGRE